jgi:hypothetical protein
MDIPFGPGGGGGRVLRRDKGRRRRGVGSIALGWSCGWRVVWPSQLRGLAGDSSSCEPAERKAGC